MTLIKLWLKYYLVQVKHEVKKIRIRVRHLFPEMGTVYKILATSEELEFNQLWIKLTEAEKDRYLKATGAGRMSLEQIYKDKYK